MNIKVTAFTESEKWSNTGNTRKFHQIDVYIYQCDEDKLAGKNIYQMSLYLGVI